MALTPAGEGVLRDARTALDAIRAAGRRARHAGRATPTLRVALKADFDAGPLPDIFTQYRGEEAALPVELVLCGRGGQAAALHEGRADVALLPLSFDDRGLDVERLLTEPRLVALAADDPLAARQVLRMTDLTGKVLPDGRPADRGGSRRLPPAGAAGVEATSVPPLPGSEARPGHLDLAQLFNVMQLGGVVWFPPVSLARRHPRPDIAYRSVSDLPPTTLAIAWPAASRSSAVAAFVRVALRVAEAIDPVPGHAATFAPAPAL